MISNDQLLKLFVRVPNGTTFNGTSVSGAVGERRLFFEEATGLIWAKGKSYGISDAQATALSTLIGEDTNKSVRDIVADVIGLEADANEVIDRLKEVIDYFNGVSESETGAALIADVAAAKAAIGTQAVLHTAATAEAANAELTGAVKAGDAAPADFVTKVGTEAADDANLTAEEAAAYNATLTGAVEEGDVKTPATGLYAYIDSKESAMKTYVDGKDSAMKTYVDNKDLAMKGYVDAQIGAVAAGSIGTEAEYYSAQEAALHNAALPGAVEAGNSVPADFETKVGSAAAGANLTNEEAAAYNATLDGAIAEGDVKQTATGMYKYIDDQDNAVKTYVDGKVAEINQTIEDNELVTAAAITDLEGRVDALEEFDPWEEYVPASNEPSEPSEPSEP